jgi:hypothetical protein
VRCWLLIVRLRTTGMAGPRLSRPEHGADKRTRPRYLRPARRQPKGRVLRPRAAVFPGNEQVVDPAHPRASGSQTDIFSQKPAVSKRVPWNSTQSPPGRQPPTSRRESEPRKCNLPHHRKGAGVCAGGARGDARSRRLWQATGIGFVSGRREQSHQTHEGQLRTGWGPSPRPRAARSRRERWRRTRLGRIYLTPASPASAAAATAAGRCDCAKQSLGKEDEM